MCSNSGSLANVVWWAVFQGVSGFALLFSGKSFQLGLSLVFCSGFTILPFYDKGGGSRPLIIYALLLVLTLALSTPWLMDYRARIFPLISWETVDLAMAVLVVAVCTIVLKKLER